MIVYSLNIYIYLIYISLTIFEIPLQPLMGVNKQKTKLKKFTVDNVFKHFLLFFPDLPSNLLSKSFSFDRGKMVSNHP